MPTVVEQIVSLGKKVDPSFAEASFGELLPLIKKYEARGLSDMTFMTALDMQKARNGIPAPQKLKYAQILTALDTWLGGKGFGPGQFDGKKPGFAYNEMVAIPGRAPLKVIAEDFASQQDVHEIVAHLKLICKIVAEMNQRPSETPWNEWFPKPAYSEVCSSLKNLDSYLNSKCQLMTYRQLTVGKRCDNSAVKKGLAGQVVPNIVMPGFERGDFRKEGGNVHVQSGLRVFFGPLYFSVKTNYDPMLKTVTIYRFMTHFHELTHKILKTLDKVYELDNCKKIKGSADAVMCADTWAYYLTDYAGKTNQLPGEGKKVNSKIAGMAAKFGGV
ncbi:MAG: hypothetical protein ACRYF4_03290 [Janthinobacterium lividum]